MRDIDPGTGRPTATDKRVHMHLTVGFFTDDNKLAHLHDPVERMATLGLLAAAIGISREQGTDGHIDIDQVLAVTGLPVDYAKTLIADGVLHQADHGCPRCPQPRAGQLYIHDILEHHRSAAQEQRVKESRRKGGNAATAARWSGHEVPEKPKRGPGRPRKNPLPGAAQLDGVEGGAGTDLTEGRRAGKKSKKAKLAEQLDPTIIELCHLLADRVRANGYSVAKELGVTTWYNPCRLLLTRGVPHSDTALTPVQIRTAIMWATDDHFWSKNVRSMAALREYYERLREDAKDSSRAKRNQLGAVRRVAAQLAAPASLPKDNSLFEDDFVGVPSGRA